ncbi:MAG: methylmalonyl-CoA epimerase [candidate division Zixibacteria bacterium]|nr:methylmalonyl-CoA epimerase [candidate division Zixibacteria bacterium]
MSEKSIISHIGIAVADLQKSIAIYSTLLGNSPAHRESVADQHVEVAIFAGLESNLKGMTHGRIELVAATSQQSPIARFISTRGEGLHHICMYCDDIEQKLAELKASGLRLIDETPRIGAEGKRIAFIHPASTGGVLIELEERENK